MERTRIAPGTRLRRVRGARIVPDYFQPRRDERDT